MAMKIMFTTFKVKGKGRFPYDMLRYDQCYPVGVGDTYNLEPDVREEREIQLASDSGRWSVPTKGRWSSFGWTVIEDDREYE